MTAAVDRNLRLKDLQMALGELTDLSDQLDAEAKRLDKLGGYSAEARSMIEMAEIAAALSRATLRVVNLLANLVTS